MADNINILLNAHLSIRGRKGRPRKGSRKASSKGKGRGRSGGGGRGRRFNSDEDDESEEEDNRKSARNFIAGRPTVSYKEDTDDATDR